MIHVTCRLTGKDRDQLRNPTLGIEDGLPFLSTAVARSSSGSVAIRYVGLLPLPWMTSYFANNRPYEGMLMLLQRVTSLRHCAQANAPAALY